MKLPQSTALSSPTKVDGDFFRTLLGKTGRYNQWLDRIFAFVDLLVEAFESSGYFQILNKVDLTTLAVAPLPRAPNETRRELNDLVRKMHLLISSDASERSFLVNVDRGLAEVKVNDSNTFRHEPTSDDDTLVDVHCLRIVVTNPAVVAEDASGLVEYLEQQLSRARRG